MKNGKRTTNYQLQTLLSQIIEIRFVVVIMQAGPRICLGKDFAYRQMKVFAAVLSHCYKFKLAVQNGAVNYRTMLTLHIDGGLHLHASHRLGPLCI